MGSQCFTEVAKDENRLVVGPTMNDVAELPKYPLVSHHQNLSLA